MRPLYIANNDHTVGYAGNKIFEPEKVISNSVDSKDVENRLESLISDGEFWEHIARVNNRIFVETTNYFDSIGSLFTLLPLTTRMISSPGAVYGKERLDYTSDTCPIKLKWFNLRRQVFLAESSQIYLELSLILRNIKSVYSIYHSFRHEKSDFSHLSEFHHIEFEGKVSQKENQTIVLKLVKAILNGLLQHNQSDLDYFLYDEDIDSLSDFTKSMKYVELTFDQVLDILYTKTKDTRYKSFTTKYFGSWEEIAVTSYMDSMVLVTEFPLYEVAFYHAPLTRNGKEVAENTDFLWPYYREFVGSGHRVRSLSELLLKAEKFNLPTKDYTPYLASRKVSDYAETSGFGLGWERFLQGVLRMPYIYSAATFPRIHSTMKP